MNSNVAAIPPRTSLVAKFAAKYSLEPEKLLVTLKSTAFKVKDGEATNEQMAALLVVADQYGLNPFTREIFAFPDKQNGIVPVVGVDGWSRIINDHEQSDGFEFRESEKHITMPDAKPCPEWMEVVIYRKDRTHPIVVREYLDEVYRPLGTYSNGDKHKPGPWQTHTKRFLRHKTLIQGARIAYGFSGIYDEDEAGRIVEGQVVPHAVEPAAAGAGARLKAAVTGPKQPEQKPAGTLEQLEKFLGAFKQCVDPEVLALKRDEALMHEWSAEDQHAIDTAYEQRKDELERGDISIADYTAKLDELASAEAISEYAEGLPEEVRNDERFAKAVKKRLEAIKGKKGGGK